MLQKDAEDKLEGEGKKCGDFKTVANKVSLRGRYDEEENEICRTCVERFEWFNSSADIRGLCGGKKKVGAPRRVWMKDIMDWTDLGKYIMVKRAAEERASWRLIVVNLCYRHEDDK